MSNQVLYIILYISLGLVLFAFGMRGINWRRQVMLKRQLAKMELDEEKALDAAAAASAAAEERLHEERLAEARDRVAALREFLGIDNKNGESSGEITEPAPCHVHS